MATFTQEELDRQVEDQINGHMEMEHVNAQPEQQLQVSQNDVERRPALEKVSSPTVADTEAVRLPSQPLEMDDVDGAPAKDVVKIETDPASHGVAAVSGDSTVTAKEDADGDLEMQDATEKPSSALSDESDDLEETVEEDDQQSKTNDEAVSGSESSESEADESKSEDDDEDDDDDDEEQDEEEEDEDEDEDEDEESSESEDEEEEEETHHDECIFCDKSSGDNSSSELHLTCSNCDRWAHEKCAQENGAPRNDDKAGRWACPSCSEHPASKSPDDLSKKDKAPRLVRDLLPVSRGIQKPNSHSIFAQPLISESEEGGRSLRKRRHSSAKEPSTVEKRRRKATPKALSNAQEESDSVSHTTRRASQKSGPTARVLQYRPPNKPPPHKFILAFRLDQAKIEKILSKPPRRGKRRDRRRPPKIPPPPVFQPPVPKFPALPTNHLIFPSMWGDRENESNAKPYGGILSEQESDTSRSLPQLKDRELFEIARKEAEEERRKTSAAAEVEINGENANVTKPSRTVSGPPSKIKCIQFGKHVIDTFYAAPYPEEYSHESRLFICEFCLKYLPSEFVAYRHKLKCPAKHPPGDEIYREGSVSIWEVDGRKKTEYCQCLCLMAKMFLGSKTLYYDVEPFLFYILTEYDEYGYHFVGYFSKEKRPASQNNVSCILVMPIHQRKGYATFLIDFSYLLTRIEGKDGSPEKPLSDMGLTAYRSYWDLTISRHLLENGMKPISTKDLMQKTGMTADDVIHSLERLYAFVKDPVTKAYAVRYDRQLYENIVLEFESKKHRSLKPGNLVWTPYIMGRSDQALLDGQPMPAIAPRDGDDTTVEALPEPSSKSDHTKTKVDITEEALSPKAIRAASIDLQHAKTDLQLINGTGHVAPGPPSTEAVTSNAVAANLADSATTGVVNGLSESSEMSRDPDDVVTGYALTYRNEKIPPKRFQIDPPIPTSMLRVRLNKRKSTNSRPQAGDSTLPSPTAVRSSPRHAASVNGSNNGTTSGAVSPEKASTPARRSIRKSGLINMEVASLDGTDDQPSNGHDRAVVEDQIQVQARDEDDDDDEESSESSSSIDEDEQAIVSSSEESEESDDNEDANDPEVELEDDDDDDDAEDEEADEEEEEDDDDDDDDPEVEIDEDESEEDDEED